MVQQNTIPLFRDYPLLEKKLPRISLATLPTPVEKLDSLGKEIGLNNLYIKRDDLSGEIYGGNKVRKLEFLFGLILKKNVKEVITFGFAGSNHALATAIYAKQLGLKSTSLLMPQVNAHYVRNNLLASHYYNARLSMYKNISSISFGAIQHSLKGMLQDGSLPRFIPAGGSCPLGIIGYVNAAMELKDQIAEGILPEPDLIYVPLGSMGTSAGLKLGLKAVGLRTRVIPIRVIEENMAKPKRMLQYIREANILLRKIDPSFPDTNISFEELEIRNDCMGNGYAQFTPEAVNAADLMRKHTGIVMNGSYSAKAFSALTKDVTNTDLAEKNILFWNTYNSRDLSPVCETVDYRQLPHDFQTYFEKDVQPLDMEKRDDQQ